VPCGERVRWHFCLSLITCDLHKEIMAIACRLLRRSACRQLVVCSSPFALHPSLSKVRELNKGKTKKPPTDPLTLSHGGHEGRRGDSCSAPSSSSSTHRILCWCLP